MKALDKIYQSDIAWFNRKKMHFTALDKIDKMSTNNSSTACPKFTFVLSTECFLHRTTWTQFNLLEDYRVYTDVHEQHLWPWVLAHDIFCHWTLEVWGDTDFQYAASGEEDCHCLRLQSSTKSHQESHGSHYRVFTRYVVCSQLERSQQLARMSCVSVTTP